MSPTIIDVYIKVSCCIDKTTDPQKIGAPSRLKLSESLLVEQ